MDVIACWLLSLWVAVVLLELSFVTVVGILQILTTVTKDNSRKITWALLIDKDRGVLAAIDSSLHHITLAVATVCIVDGFLGSLVACVNRGENEPNAHLRKANRVLGVLHSVTKRTALRKVVRHAQSSVEEKFEEVFWPSQGIRSIDP